jgi:branched-chain amino acid transport system ATP-binding protein
MLIVRELSKKFGGINAVDDLSFNVKKGTIHSIIGPNGAGKTTLVNMITGIYKVTRGEVYLQKGDLANLPPSSHDIKDMIHGARENITNMPMHKLVHKGVCRTFQHLEICENLTVLENIMLGFNRFMSKNIFLSSIKSKKITEDEQKYEYEAIRYLKIFNLEEIIYHKASSLSYGVLKKIEIIRALSTKPRLILFDEPVAGLNPKETAEVSQIIKEITKDGLSVILVEHDMKMVMQVSDEVTVVNFGRKLANGTPLEIANNEDVIKAYLGTKYVKN